MEKVLFIHHWSSVGGSGISLYNTWKSLEKTYRVVAYIPENPLDLYEFLISKGLKPKTYSFTCGQIPYYSGGSTFYKPGFWRLIYNSIKQIKYWKEIIKEESPEIIMVNSKVLCWMAPLFKGKKSVCFVRETIKGRSINPINIVMKMFLEQFSLVSFLSEYDLIQTNLKITNVVVSPDILNPDEYVNSLSKKEACKILKVRSDTFNVAFVGGVDRLKGIDIAVKAMKHIKDNGIRLLVAGNDIGSIKSNSNSSFLAKIINRRSVNFSKKIKKFIEKNKLVQSIEFLGVLTDVSTLYSASDILIFPMKKAHQARPAFEIGIQHKPVIVSNFKNIQEFIKDGENGLLFEPNNELELANKIMNLKENKELLNKVGNSNYEYTMKFHTENYSIGELLDALSKI